MTTAIIKSSNTAATLTFLERKGDYFSVCFESPGVSVKKRVWGYTDCEFLVGLFETISREWRGWKGALDWNSIESDYCLSATCDSLGHVMLEIQIREVEGPEVWSSEVSLGIDSGQTENVAKVVRKFFET